MQAPTLFQNILRPRCPRCGKGKLFANLLKIGDCGACGLSLHNHDAGDGPMFFAIIMVGAITMAGSGIVEYKFSPPAWVHILLWGPLTFALCILILRTVKTALITLEFRTGRLGGN